MTDETSVLFVTGDADRTEEAAALDATAGFDASVVEGGAAAIRAIADGSADCVVLDHDPPAIDAVATLAALRERDGSFPTIVYPTEGSEALASAAVATGADDYLPRGDSPRTSALATRIRSAVNHYRNSPEIGTDEVRSEAELAGMIDSLLNTIPRSVSIYFKDRKGRHRAVSEHMTELIETPYLKTPDGKYLHTKEDVLGKTDFDIYERQLARETRRDERRIMETEEPIVNKQESTGDDVEGVYVSTTKAPWYDADGTVRGIVGITIDVTDRVERRRALERQNERLERFASVLSHDLRNPLTVAKGSVELLESSAADVDDDPVDDIEWALDRIEELVTDVLALARQGEVVDDAEPTALDARARDAWRTVDAPGATLAVAADPPTVEADPERLRTLFENLFRNAVEHGSTSPDSQARQDAVEHAGPDVTVEVGPLDDSGFYVEDDGPGIPDEEAEDVFEQGYSTADDGTGFGLAIVREIATAHGWSVRLADRSGDERSESSGGGARFEFTGVTTVDAD